LPIIPEANRQSADWAGRRSQLIDQASERGFEVVWFGIEIGDPLEQGAFQLQSGNVRVLAAQPLPRPQFLGSQQQ
jgi:hypothetical protein